MKQCSSQGKPLCLANIDVDNFKKFNDTYGHDFGDKVLKKVAELMSKSITNTCEGYPIRMGGDEFMVLGVGVEKQRFKAIMNKLCIMVDDCKLPYNNQLVSIKISIGVSEMLSDNITTSKQLYEKADQQLYCAKEAGKGCVR
jgi:diguanylate cyclase (GGDEF)-like protein